MEVHLNTKHFTVSKKYWRSLDSSLHELILETEHPTTYITSWNSTRV
jgi:hypothetical protein